jgi:hypothetical protein
VASGNLGIADLKSDGILSIIKDFGYGPILMISKFNLLATNFDFLKNQPYLPNLSCVNGP